MAELPHYMRSLPTQDFGGKSFVVPWFVAKVGDRYDFRVVKKGAMSEAHNKKLCWLCGQPRGVHMTFVIGPMCTINRISSEPPSHTVCARYAAETCPFLSRPQMRRSPRDLPENHVGAAGVGIMRNPGVVALWTTKSYKPFRVEERGPAVGGVLFQIGEPEKVTWIREGRLATREEVLASVDSGFPALLEAARLEEDADLAVRELMLAREDAINLLPMAA